MKMVIVSAVIAGVLTFLIRCFRLISLDPAYKGQKYRYEISGEEEVFIGFSNKKYNPDDVATFAVQCLGFRGRIVVRIEERWDGE